MICTWWSGRYCVSNRSVLFLSQNTLKEQGCHLSHSVAEKALLEHWNGGRRTH